MSGGLVEMGSWRNTAGLSRNRGYSHRRLLSNARLITLGLAAIVGVVPTADCTSGARHSATFSMDVNASAARSLHQSLLHLSAMRADQSVNAAVLDAEKSLGGTGGVPEDAGEMLFNVGAVLSHPEGINYFNEAINDAQGTYEIGLVAKSVHMSLNPIRMAESVCDQLISQQVFAVVISSPLKGELTPAAVSYTCGFYSIPVIGISSRHSSLSDKNLHKTFLRTVPPYSHQADVWVKLLRHLGYQSVVFVHSSDNDGRATLGRLHSVASQQQQHQPVVHIEHVIEFSATSTNLTAELRNASRRHCRVYILYADTNEAAKVFEIVDKLKMATSGYVWIVSEQALKAPNCPEGVLGLDLVNAVDERAHIRDSVNLVAIALKRLQRDSNVTAPQLNCSNLEHNWDAGLKLVSILKQQVLVYGETGNVRFDEKGDRLNSDYVIFNTQRDDIGEIQLVKVGEYSYSEYSSKGMDLKINLDAVRWPGNVKEKPLGFVIPKHLRVATLAERPFVWSRPVNSSTGCLPTEIPCPLFNRSAVPSTTGGREQQHFCCKGYCMDLLQFLALKLNFSYDLYLVEDGQYGNLDYGPDGTKVWTGLIGDLVRKKADMVVAPLTITPERSVEVDFTKPFKYQGITILAKKQDKSSTLASFLQPFQKSLWLLVMVSVHVVAIGLYLLDRFSPFGNFRLPAIAADREMTAVNAGRGGNGCVLGSEDDGLNLSSALWFAWGVLLNSGIAEDTPRSFSGRVLGMVWAGFAMIVVASYTANLAAFLVLEKPESSLAGINDPRLRNPSENFTYATVRASAVDTYFKRQVELQNMYRIMEGRNFDTVDQGIEALMNGNIDAFIWDSSRLEYEAARHCDLLTAGEPFGRSGYGVALQRNSFWVDKVTLALLEMHESGHMEQLDSSWIHNGGWRCATKLERTPATLGLTNMAGVFILVGAGVLGGLVLIVIEVNYKRYLAKQKKKMRVARKAAAKWRGVVERRRSLRRPPHHRIMLPSNIQQPPASLASTTCTAGKTVSCRTVSNASIGSCGAVRETDSSASADINKRASITSQRFQQKQQRQKLLLVQRAKIPQKTAAASKSGLIRLRSTTTGSQRSCSTAEAQDRESVHLKAFAADHAQQIQQQQQQSLHVQQQQQQLQQHLQQQQLQYQHHLQQQQFQQRLPSPHDLPPPPPPARVPPAPPSSFAAAASVVVPPLPPLPPPPPAVTGSGVGPGMATIATTAGTGARIMNAPTRYLLAGPQENSRPMSFDINV